MNTKTKTILKSALILGAFTLSLSALAVWSPPESGTVPPNNNTPSPVHVGGAAQYKVGSLVVGGFRSIGLALFDSNVEIAGTIKIAGGSPGDGKVLTSDANGLASWATAGSGSGPWSRSTSAPYSIYPTEPTDRITLPYSTGTDPIAGVIYKGGNRFLHNYGSTTSSANTFLGINSGNFTTTGKFNTGVGENTLDALTTGGGNVPSGNTAVGYNALSSNTSGGENTGIGINALYNNNANSPNGGGNTAVGASAMYSNTTGNNNVAIGMSALYNNTTGSDNIAIGRTSNVGSGGLTNAIAIGASTSVNASNKVRIGNSQMTVYETQVAWTVGSDERFKKNIQGLDLGLDFIKSLRPVSYQLKTETDGRLSYGFIAQEVERALGERKAKLVDTQPEGEQMKYMRYDDLIAPMVKAIQEQQAQIEELKKEIEILKANQN